MINDFPLSDAPKVHARVHQSSRSLVDERAEPDKICIDLYLGSEGIPYELATKRVLLCMMSVANYALVVVLQSVANRYQIRSLCTESLEKRLHLRIIPKISAGQF